MEITLENLYLNNMALRVKLSYHMSICVEYSVDPKSTSGGLYLQKNNKYLIFNNNFIIIIIINNLQ